MLETGSLIKLLPMSCSITSENVTDQLSAVISVLNIDLRASTISDCAGSLFYLVLKCIACYEKM